MASRARECESCGEPRGRFFCDDCGRCSDCCDCDDDLFDADELGLDPEDDSRRLHHEEE